MKGKKDDQKRRKVIWKVKNKEKGRREENERKGRGSKRRGEEKTNEDNTKQDKKNKRDIEKKWKRRS